MPRKEIIVKQLRDTRGTQPDEFAFIKNLRNSLNVDEYPLTEKDRQIGKSIVLAQVASDGGKDIHDIKNIFRDSYPVWQLGYNAKDAYIWRAIKFINESKNSKFRYYISRGDISGSYLIYFNINLTDMGIGKLQVSFHSFDEKFKSWISRSRHPAYVTHWDEKSSRDAAITLAEVLKGNWNQQSLR